MTDGETTECSVDFQSADFKMDFDIIDELLVSHVFGGNFEIEGGVRLFGVFEMTEGLPNSLVIE